MALDKFRRIDMQINRANDYQIETQFVKEGDYNGRELVVQITDAGEVSNQSGVSLNLGWKHNSAGNSGLDPFRVVDASKGIFKITYPTEMLITGDVTASIQVLESGRITLTRNFKITVENNPIDEGAIVSENSFTLLQEALIKVNDLEDNYAPRLNEVTAQLAETAKHLSDWVNVKSLGAKGDGITDDTTILQQAIDNHDNIYFPEGNYLFTKLDINHSNKKISFSENVKLKSNLVLNDDRAGYIDIRGTAETMKYFLQRDVDRLTNSLYVEPNEATQFQEGDIIEIEQNRPFDGSSQVTNELEHRQQNSYAILSVKSINSSTGKIETYESIPYQFLTVDNPYIRKVNAVKNIELLGANTQFDKLGDKYLGAFFYATYANNITIKGFHCLNGAGKGIQTYKVNKYHISDFTYSTPTDRGSAKGDGIVINLSGYGLIEKCFIYYPGRGIDFAQGWNSTVRDSMVMQGGFSTHGLLSTYITFENCSVYGEPKETELSFYGFSFGNVDYMLDEYINITNCNVYGGFHGMSIVAKSKHIKVTNSNFYNNVYGIASVDAKNINIHDSMFYDCDMDISFNHVTNSKIKDCTIYAETYTTRGAGGIITTGDTKHIDIDGLNVLKNRNHILSIKSNLDGDILKVKNSVFRNLFSGINLLYTNGVEIKDSEFSDRISFYGTSNIFLNNCTLERWLYGGENVPSKNFIVKNNIVKGLNGVSPTITTDIEKNIIHDGNIYMKTVS